MSTATFFLVVALSLDGVGSNGAVTISLLDKVTECGASSDRRDVGGDEKMNEPRQVCLVLTQDGTGTGPKDRGQLHTGRPGEEDHRVLLDDDPTPVRILGIVVDKPGYCYAITTMGESVLVRCSR